MKSMLINRKWTTEMETQLIEEVRKKSHLWNTKDSLYSKKTMKKMGYEEIAKKFRSKYPECSGLFTADQIMCKFSTMKGYFKKELRKANALKSQSGGIECTPKWEHFLKMTFLQDVVVSSESISDFSEIVLHNELNENSWTEVIRVKSEISISDCEDSSIASSKSLERCPSPKYVCEDPSISSRKEPVRESGVCDSSSASLNNGREACPSACKDFSISSKKDLDRQQRVCARSSVSSNKRQKTWTPEERNDATVMSQGEDSCAEDAYANFLASQLKQIEDSKDRDRARLEIQTILMKYKYGTSK